ncbi:MAG: PD-(D/E)XK nuclease family protein [Flavobacteriaceae bacterium]|nr:PD-(D/E)XK nuclease family protein [Flavobacteriaceae bacterium]
MTSFIHEVLLDLKEKHFDISDLTFILPSKRAGTFLQKEISKIYKQTLFAPTIYSIEHFVEELSNLNILSNIELLFEFYTTYKSITPKATQDSFDAFSKWAQVLLQDFNEIDRYLIPQKKIFNYLSAIQELNHQHWSLDECQTEMTKNHLEFWKKLFKYYTEFTTRLLTKRKGYQGLIYREAVEHVTTYIERHLEVHHVFIGFNALNTSETRIIQEFLQNGNASIYWDIDRVFMEHHMHDASLFIKQHKTSWSYFENKSFNWISDNYRNKKNIEVLGIPKNIGQAKYIGALLKTLNDGRSPKDIAVILGNENLLFPILNSIPDTIDTFNITMGFPLRLIPMSSLFDQLFAIHKAGKSDYYYVDIIALLSHPSLSVLFLHRDINYAEVLIQHIQSNNIVQITLDELLTVTPEVAITINLLFDPWKNDPTKALKQCMQIIYKIKETLSDPIKHRLTLEYLYKFHNVFNTLNTLSLSYTHLDSITSLYSLYKEILSAETLDFQGEPLEGLQIMGMLESRVLDFDTVIISGVNEGILPSGKSNNSFIPYDVKLENGLPTYKEKDAVYTYHFYRLIQRAKKVYILYNTEPDVIDGGEKSRFITQLEIEGIHNINHHIVTPKTPKLNSDLRVITKTPTVLNQIKKIALKGFSPSSLSSYIRNPLEFYYQRVLELKDYDKVEETIAANTLGTVIHNTLEDFYIPLINNVLSESSIKEMQTKIETTVSKHFKKAYKAGNTTKGKNLIIYEIAKRYISNFLETELQAIKQGYHIKIIALERKYEVEVRIPQLEGVPITLKGTVDRIDECNGVLRIIDYKTGKVEQNKVEILDWNDITRDYDKYSKSFQLLMYAYMIHCEHPLEKPIEAGIISFKNLKSGVLKFAKKDHVKGKIKTHQITAELMLEFETQLHNLILEICNPSIPFIEKEIIELVI